MSQYQLILSQKVTLSRPIIHLVMTQISTSPVPKKQLLCPIIHLEDTQNQLLLSQKITLVRSEICLVMTISQLLLSQKVTLFCPIFHLVLTQY
jgi:hypothetical protein